MFWKLFIFFGQTNRCLTILIISIILTNVVIITVLTIICVKLCKGAHFYWRTNKSARLFHCMFVRLVLDLLFKGWLPWITCKCKQTILFLQLTIIDLLLTYNGERNLIREKKFAASFTGEPRLYMTSNWPYCLEFTLLEWMRFSWLR